MALPKLNDKPKYEMKIPSTGDIVRFRPFLVKEEKVLMIAMESEDNRQMLNAVVDTLDACVDGGLNKTKLTTFDVEFMFTKLRSKSVGETSTIVIECDHCKEKNEVNVNLESLDIETPSGNRVIEISDTISIEMQYPLYSSITDISDENMNSTEAAFDLLRSCIAYVITEDERIDMRDENPEEIQEFIESMDRNQFQLIQDFVDGMPKLSHDIEFECVSCKMKNKKTLEGMANFF